MRLMWEHTRKILGELPEDALALRQPLRELDHRRAIAAIAGDPAIRQHRERQVLVKQRAIPTAGHQVTVPGAASGDLRKDLSLDHLDLGIVVEHRPRPADHLVERIKAKHAEMLRIHIGVAAAAVTDREALPRLLHPLQELANHDRVVPLEGRGAHESARCCSAPELRSPLFRAFITSSIAVRDPVFCFILPMDL
jgi:hypothetical protein